MVLTYCLVCSVCQEVGKEGRVVLQGPARECSASFPDEAAPSQKSKEETALCSGQNWTQPVPD